MSTKHSAVKKSGTISGTRTSKSQSPLTATQAAVSIAAETAELDIASIGWNNLEQKFSELRAMLSAPTSGLNANEARAQQKKTVSAAIVQLLDKAQQECRRLLIEGNAKAAVEGGLKTLKLKEDYYGHGSLQLVPAYFHLARTNQYMDKFKAAEEFLSLAQWTILRNKDVDVSIKAELHQTFGLLYASDSKLDAALKQLTCATYYLCVMNGPEHVLTSFGYFDLGNVFAAKSNMENAMAFYDKVKDIWYNHLSLVLRQALEPDKASQSTVPFATPNSFGLENLQDAVKMLRGIVGLQTERYGKVHPSTARAELVLGMFMLWNGDAVSALSSLLKSLEISKRVFGERHPSTGEVRSLLLNYSLQVPEDTSHVLDEQEAAPETAATQPTAQEPANSFASKEPVPEPVPVTQSAPEEEPPRAAEEPNSEQPALPVDGNTQDLEQVEPTANAEAEQADAPPEENPTAPAEAPSATAEDVTGAAETASPAEIETAAAPSDPPAPEASNQSEVEGQNVVEQPAMSSEEQPVAQEQ